MSIVTAGISANISVGIVEPDNQGARYNDLAAGEPFTDYMSFNKYERDNHVYMLGITSPSGFNGNRAAFVQLASPTQLLLVRWTACRAITQPVAPDPALTDSNWVLMDVIPEAAQQGVCNDGATPLYRISGTYVYGHKNPSANVFSDVVFPRPAWLEEIAPYRSFPLGNLQKGIIEEERVLSTVQGGGVGGPSTLTGFTGVR